MPLMTHTVKIVQGSAEYVYIHRAVNAKTINSPRGHIKILNALTFLARVVDLNRTFIYFLIHMLLYCLIFLYKGNVFLSIINKFEIK